MAAFLAKSFSLNVLNLNFIGCRLPVMQKELMKIVCVRQSKREKHYHPDFKRHRWAKVLKIDLPDFDKMREDSKMSPDERRAKQKKEGVPFPVSYREREIVIASTSSIFEQYVPPEGDGKASIITGERATQSAKEFGKKGQSINQSRKIRKYDEAFDRNTFGQEAQDIYINAHELLNDFRKNEEELHDYVTEKAYPEMTDGLMKKTVRWRFVESLEPPRVVHVRTSSLISDDNMYGQVTVRFHTRQTLAIYDRFGRLMYGGENLIKDCLDYVVFEKHLSDEYGRWRLHGKIVPEWMPRAEPIRRTMRQPDVEEDETMEYTLLKEDSVKDNAKEATA